jgi:hypothetical protein
MTSDHVVRVEQACHDLLAAGRPATIAEVAARSGIGRSTLYRHPEQPPSSTTTASTSATP